MKKKAAKNEYRLVRGLGDRLGSALIAAAIGGSMAMALIQAMGLSVTVLQAYGTALGVAACLAAACSSPFLALGVLLGVGALVLGACQAGLNPWGQFMGLLGSILAGEEGVLQALQSYTGVSIALFMLFFGGVSYALARMQGGVYPLLALTLAVFLGAWYLSGEAFTLQLVLSLFALSAMLARSREFIVPWKEILPFALIVSLLAGVCMPQAGTTWEPLEQVAQSVRDLITDYFNFTSPRTSYTVATDGFQPMGERLGGPATPLSDQVLEIQTDQTILLRGSIKRSYTTYSWVDNGVNNRYLYADMTKAGLRNRLFSADLAGRADIGSAFVRSRISVRFLDAGSSSLFVPDIVEDLSAPIEMAVYFNDTGEIFLTRDVQAGDSYSAVGLSPVHGSAMASFLQQTAQLSDENYDAIRTEYTALPDGIQDGVYALAREVVSGAQTPYEAAWLLCTYLRSGEYVYETDVDYPPYGTDFVSHFLLDSKQGYCTYFASAMAVMARMVGLPSRYVEGYLVQPDGETTIVTGEDAHAWVEIYFRGAGWIAFDPTPGEGDGTGGSGGQNDEPDQMPEPSPTPESTPQAEDDGLEQPTPEPEDSLITPEPTSEITPPQSEDNPGVDDDERHNWIWKLLLVLLVLALLAALVFWREKATRPGRIATREPDAGARLLIWYRAMLDVLGVCNMEPQPGETPIATARRLAATPGDWDAFVQISEVVAVCRYSGGEPNEHAIELAETAYGCLLAQMPRRVQIKWLLRRMSVGMGSWKQIP